MLLVHGSPEKLCLVSRVPELKRSRPFSRPFRTVVRILLCLLSEGQESLCPTCCPAPHFCSSPSAQALLPLPGTMKHYQLLDS